MGEQVFSIKNGRSLGGHRKHCLQARWTVGGGSFYEMGQGQLIANSLQINSGGEFDCDQQLSGKMTGLSVASGATYTLSGPWRLGEWNSHHWRFKLVGWDRRRLIYAKSGESGFSNVSGVAAEQHPHNRKRRRL